jgi:DNA-binding response OmpR family regulator
VAPPSRLTDLPGRVLVCEDDAGVRTLLSESLSQAGLEVEVTEDGRAGLERATAWGPDAIVVDWLMPGLDGISLCVAAREHPGLALAHIVVVTGRHEPEYAQMATDAGADAVITKPFDAIDLAEGVRAGIRRARAARRVIACSRTDAATGLRDERCLGEDLDRLLALAQTLPLQIAVAGCVVRDDAGTNAVESLAGSLAGVLGPADTLYRASFGEISFAVVAPDADQPALLDKAIETAAIGAGASDVHVAAMLIDGGRSADVLRVLGDRLAHGKAA